MTHLNWVFGAHVVSVLTGQYEDPEGQAMLLPDPAGADRAGSGSARDRDGAIDRLLGRRGRARPRPGERAGPAVRAAAAVPGRRRARRPPVRAGGEQDHTCGTECGSIVAVLFLGCDPPLYWSSIPLLDGLPTIDRACVRQKNSVRGQRTSSNRVMIVDCLVVQFSY